uniref:UPF0606 protein KIAA1549L isoform X1 n=1 Tax=Solea senegalensis TaxID=28829 RepID=UPI001CD85134|nr:UPF0606 protein KIAA1549L isoform X1 [Solea senegalensis]
MAPGLRSGCAGRHRAEPGGGCGGCSGCTEDAAAGEWRCLRGRCRAGAAVELRHCLLTVGMLSLLVRCAVAAAEEKSTYDASGSSSLLSDPAATAAPAHPSTGLSVAEEVPFLAARSDGDSELAGGGLSGQPAFSSVLTVMAGTVKHPVSLDQSRTSPTITKDETHTTKWPSHSSSGSGSEMSSSSSSSYVRDRIPASSGLTPSMPHQHTSPRQAVTLSSPSHVSVFMDVKKNENVSSFSSSTASLSLFPSPAPSTSSMLLSLLSLSPSTELMNKAPSSQGHRTVFSAARPTESVTFSPAMPLSSTDSSTATAEHTTHSGQGWRRTSTESSHISNKLAEQQLYATTDKIHGVAYSKVMTTPAISSYRTSYSSSNTVHDPFKILVKPTEMHNSGMNSVSASNLKNSTLVRSNQESQAVEMQQELSQEPTSALSSAPPNGSSVSSDVAQQMVDRTAHAEKTDSQTFVHKRDGHAVTSRTVNPTVSPAMTLKPTASFLTISSGAKSLSESAITNLTPIDSGMVSLEHSSNRGDLRMAPGHGHPAVSVINIKNKLAGAELKSISTQAHQNNSLSHTTKTRPESTAGLIARAGTTFFTTGSLNLQSNVTANLRQFVTQKTSPRGIIPKHIGWTALKIFSSDSGTVSLSGTALPAGSAKYMTYKSVHGHFSQPSRPTYPLPLFRSPDHSAGEGLTGSSEVNSADQTEAPLMSKKPVQATPFLNFLHEFYTTSGLMPYDDKSQQTLSSGEVSPYDKKSEGAGLGKPLTFKVQTNAGNSKSSPSSTLHMLYGKSSAETLVSPLFNRKEESPLIKSTLFYTWSVPLGRSTTQFPSLMTTEDALMMNKGSDGSNKASPTELSLSQVTFDGGLGASISLSRKDGVTVMGPRERSSSSWSEITTTLRTNSSQRAQGPAVIVSSNKSKLYLGTETASPSTASSAAATSSSDGQNSIETVRPILSFGTKLMAPYKRWKATKPASFQSSTFDSGMTPSGFDRANSNLIPDGASYEHPNLEDTQEHRMHILNSNDPTLVASDPYSVHPTVGGYPSLTYGKGTSDYKEQSMTLSLAALKFGAAVSLRQIVTANTGAPPVWGPDTSAPLTHISTDSVTSSRDAPLAFAYRSMATRPPNTPVHSFTDTDHVRDTRDSEPNEFTSPRERMLSSSDASSPSHFSAFHLTTSKASSLLSPSSSSTSRSADVTLSSKPTVFSAIDSTPPPPPPDSLSSSLILTDSECPECTTDVSVVLTEAGTGEPNTGTSRAVALPFLKEKEVHLSPSQSARTTLSAGPSERTSQVPPLRPDTTTAYVKLASTSVASTATTKNTTTSMPSLNVTTGSTQSTTTTTQPPAPVTRRVITTTTTTTTNTRTQTSRRAFTPLIFRTSPPRAATTAFISPFTTTTEAPPQQCNITERLWVKTVVSIYVRRNRLDSIQRQNLRRGLSQGLRKALNDTSAQAQVETVFGSPNMTVAYHVTGGDMVYSPSVVLEGLNSYGRDKLIADLRQYLPMVTALPLPAALWRPSAATGFQLKTVLQFVGAGDNPRSCRFSQMMERRLEKVFSEAQAKVLSTNSRLSVQMLSVTQAAGSPAVSLVYTVSNGTVFLNGTTASNLLGQLSAELVGYFLFYPPLIIAEPLEYHNLNTSVATRDFWVITVIQDVDNVSLEGQYQSFANLMEQRLAELFVLAGQQGTRFRRATAVGSYTVQMVSIRRVSGLRNPAEMTYYVQQHGLPLLGTSAAKVLNTVDSQTIALTLGYFVQLQAEPVVKNPPNNLWIIAAVLAPISVVTLIIIIITAVLCRKNKNDFKADAIGNLNPRAKMAYRRDVGYYHQPVQGFDYAKQHLGQQGGDEETLPVSQDTLVMSLQIRDTPLSLEKALHQDGTAHKKSLSNDKHKSKLPSEDGSVISNESEKLNSGRGLTVPKVTAQQKLTKEETRKRDDPYDTSSGSLQLISIKPVAAQPSYSHPASSDRSQDSAIVNGEVNLALKQKSDIEHYRNKLRLKAKRKGYYDFPSTDGSSSSRALAQRQRHSHERAAGEHGRPLEPDDERGSTYVKSHRRHSQVGQTAYRSRQSLSSPSPGGTEMDLLVMRERPRRGIRNSGYDTEPELIEETNVDRLMGPRGYMYGRGLKGHSETSTLSSQPSIDEVRQQMHLLLEEAFSLASGGQSTSGRQSHHHQLPPDHYSPAPPPLPYADVVTSAPGTMSCGRGGLQWVPSYGADVYQCSLPKPAFRFTQLPEMAMDSPPPLPPRTGPPPGKSLRRSTSDLGPKGRISDTSLTGMQSHHDSNPYGPTTRAALPSITAEQPLSNYSGNPITAVYAIPASRSGYSEYFLSTPPTSYHSPSWMSYPPEPEDVPPQWADSLPLPGYVEAFPHPRYPQGSPTRLPLEYKQALEQPYVAPSTASQQSLPHVGKDMDSMPLSSLSTSALVQAIRQEVAKLAKKQNEMFEF